MCLVSMSVPVLLRAQKCTAQSMMRKTFWLAGESGLLGLVVPVLRGRLLVLLLRHQADLLDVGILLRRGLLPAAAASASALARGEARHADEDAAEDHSDPGSC